jgi:hypothetical protein
MERVPLRDYDVLWLQGDSFELEALLAAVEPLDLSPKLTSKFSLIEAELRQLLIEKGVSYLWRLTRLTEAVLPPGAATRPALLSLVRSMLEQLSPTRSLTIVDPYLLGDGSEQPADLLDIIGDTPARIAALRLITRPLRESTALDALRCALIVSAPECRVEHSASTRYHDRFWIVDEARGLFVGTSLNGIGKRYSLADYLDVTDVAEIVADLRREGLL